MRLTEHPRRDLWASPASIDSQGYKSYDQNGSAKIEILGQSGTESNTAGAAAPGAVGAGKSGSAMRLR